MKKIFFGTILFASAYSINAQVTDSARTAVNDPINSKVKVYHLRNTGVNEAYAAPSYIVTDFERNYPGAVTYVVWEPVTYLWRASYKENNRISHVYYNTNGVHYKVSLPLINSFVPESVISAAIDTYGTALYSINRMKPIGDIEIYQVRLNEDTLMTNTWMDSKGAVLTEAEVFKIRTDNDKLKIKSDEEKLKMKLDE
jgi:hypothetical protein